MKKMFCCPALELFHCLPLWKTVRLHGKKLQNATKPLCIAVVICQNAPETETRYIAHGDDAYPQRAK